MRIVLLTRLDTEFTAKGARIEKYAPRPTPR